MTTTTAYPEHMLIAARKLSDVSFTRNARGVLEIPTSTARDTKIAREWIDAHPDESAAFKIGNVYQIADALAALRHALNHTERESARSF